MCLYVCLHVCPSLPSRQLRPCFFQTKRSACAVPGSHSVSDTSVGIAATSAPYGQTDTGTQASWGANKTMAEEGGKIHTHTHTHRCIQDRYGSEPGLLNVSCERPLPQITNTFLTVCASFLLCFCGATHNVRVVVCHAGVTVLALAIRRGRWS